MVSNNSTEEEEEEEEVVVVEENRIRVVREYFPAPRPSNWIEFLIRTRRQVDLLFSHHHNVRGKLTRRSIPSSLTLRDLHDDRLRKVKKTASSFLSLLVN